MASNTHARSSNRLVSGITQICLVVNDFEKRVGELSGRFGIGPFKCWNFNPPHILHTTFRGEKVLWTMKLGMAWVGNFQLEVIQPEKGPSLYKEYLAIHGEGAHHLLVSTGSIGFDQAIERMVSAGYPVGQEAMINIPVKIGPLTLPPLPSWLANFLAPKIAYMETEAALKTVLELSKLPPRLFRFGIKRGKPDYWIPANRRDFDAVLPNHFINRISHIGIVTHDLDQLIHNYEKSMGVGPWKVSTLEPPRLSRVKLRGHETQFRVRIAAAQVGDKLLEIVQPLEGESLHKELLEARGERIHYIGVVTDDDFSNAVKRFISLGSPVVMEGEIEEDYRFSYLNTQPFAAITMEIREKL